MLPKSAMVAATRAECHDVVLADGETFAKGLVWRNEGVCGLT
ncbi:unnamed protein product [Ectocarpus sp. 12 AP-2014]